MLSDVITTEDVRDYVGIDYTDEVIIKNINHAIITADAYLTGSLGEGYPVEDPRVQTLALFIVAELYDNRGIIESLSGNTRKLVNDLEWQIRLEMRRSRNDSTV